MGNNYSTPSASLVNTTDNTDALQAGIAGDYQLAIGDVISEAWQKTKGIKRYVLGAGILLYIVMFVFIMILGVIMALTGQTGETISAGSVVLQFVVQIALMAVILPFIGGIFIMCVKHIQGHEVSFGDLFSCLGKTGSLLITAILMNIMIFIGFMLFIIPGIYLSVAYILTVPLVVDRGLSPWEALEASRKAITKKWFTVFGFYLVLLVIMVVSMIPLGLGLIWTIPMMAVAFAIFYRQVFGIESY